MISKTYVKLIIALILLFAFRLFFGLSSTFWFEDELRIYLSGLKFYTTGLWPYFGPEVVYTHSQIPGALQALLVGLPFYILPVPESPYVFLNLLSLGSLSLLAWYCTKRFPHTPSWFIWIWILTCPWTLNLSTHVLNPSYVLTGGILFFIAFFEIIPTLRINFIKPAHASFLLGLSFFWIYQLHMSWVILVPFILIAFYFNHQKKSILFFFLGTLVTASLVVPTYFKYGIHGTGGAESNIVFNPENILSLFTIIARYLSFASFELSRFLGPSTKTRIMFLSEHYWVIPFAVFTGIVGILQSVVMVIEFFRKKDHPEWKIVKYMNLMVILLLYFSFLFSIKDPASHTFYVLFPLSMIYAFYCWERYLQRSFWKRFSVVFLISGVLVHIAIASNGYSKESMYSSTKYGTARVLVSKAIKGKNYTIVGTR